MSKAGPEREHQGADEDVPYRFGKHPLTYLSEKAYARLLARWPRREPIEREAEA